MNRYRKLHCEMLGGGRLRVQLCRVDDRPAGHQLVSSTDGLVAMEVHRPARELGTHWETTSKRELRIEAGDTPADVARLAFYALAEPDVGAIHVVTDLKHGVTFVRDMPGWLDVPRFAHPIYSIAPASVASC